MNVKDYLRASVFDFIICLVAAVAIGYVNCGAFYVSDAVHNNIALLLLTTALPLLILFFAAYDRRSLFIGVAVLVVGTVIACGVASVAGGAESVFQDSETNPNPAIFIFVMVVSTCLVFLLTRRRWMARVFVVFTILDICWVEFMYKQGYAWALLAALIAAGVMVVYRNYRTNLKDASTEKVSFSSATAVAAVYSAALVALACLLFFGVVTLFHPGALEFKPFQRYMNYETVQMTGVGDTQLVDDPNNLTNQLNNDMDQTQNENENEADPNSGDNTQMNPLESQDKGDKTVFGGVAALLQEMYNFVITNPPLAFAYFALFILVFFVAPFFIKKKLRARRFEAMCAKTPNEAVEEFFLFCMKRFKILNIKKPQNATLSDFAVLSKGPLAEFGQNEKGVTFGHIIAMYMASVYGKVPLDQEEMDYIKSFYSTFYKAFAQKSGKIRYAFRFFRV